jgi:hypothetical protein
MGARGWTGCALGGAAGTTAGTVELASAGPRSAAIASGDREAAELAMHEHLGNVAAVRVDVAAAAV